MTPPSLRAAAAPRAAAWIAALSILLFLGTSPAAGAEAGARAGLSYGIDSNPLELSSGERSGAYTEAEVEAGVRPEPGERLGFLGGFRGVLRRHTSRADGADSGWGEARAGLAAVAFARGPRRFAILAGGAYRSFRMTLIDPDTGEVYRLATGSGATVAVSDRLDFDSRGAFVDLRWQTGRRLLFYVDTEWTRRNYVEDYARSAELEPLDHTTATLEPGVRARVAPGLIIDLSWARSRREYDELSSLDRNAVAASGEERVYLTSRWQAALRIDPGARWQVIAGYRARDRSDRHAGYYDARGRGSVLSARWKAGERTFLRATLSTRSLGYPNATVNNDPAEESRRSTTTRYVGRIEHRISSRVEAFAAGGSETHDSSDAAWEHRRTWVQAGVQIGSGP